MKEDMKNWLNRMEPQRMGFDHPDAVDYQPGDTLVNSTHGFPTHPFAYVLRPTPKGFVQLPLKNWLRRFPDDYAPVNSIQ